MLRLVLIHFLAVVLQMATYAQPVGIGYTNSIAVTNLSQSVMSEIGQLKWYFTHASVGGNMVSGVADLRSVSTNFYQFRTTSEDGTPPTTTQTGMIYEHNRGNPGWQEKVDQFQTCISNGWRFPKINLAVNKFCYIDQDADLAYYIRSMTNLESAFPQTLFVYMTIPLMNTTDYDNYLRNLFNDGLRNWTRTNNRVLFDIADIEAHETNGTLRTFTYNSRVCQRLCDGYTDDGGHLNTGGRQLVAKGYYALAAALLNVDRDNDGLPDTRELIAGSSPADARSSFKMPAATRTASGGMSIQWTSTSNRLYTIQRGTNVAVPASFTNLLLDMSATPPLNVVTDVPPGKGPFFYRVKVRQ